jgi:glucose-6-phosphate isomerase
MKSRLFASKQANSHLEVYFCVRCTNMGFMNRISFDRSFAKNFIGEHEIDIIAPQVEAAAELLHSGKGPGSEFTGWLNLPLTYDKAEFQRIQIAAQEIRSRDDVHIVIGIGGSYLGAKAVIECLGHSYSNSLSKTERGGPEIYFAGINMSPLQLQQLLQVLEGKDFSVNVISKSGTTTEPAIAFRILRQLLESKYGKEGAVQRIYATTDKEKGALKNLANHEGYQTFVVPDDIGGRYSILTAVGLLPIAVAGIDISSFMSGAESAAKELNSPFSENACYQYVAARNVLLRKGKAIEILVNYEPAFHFISEWWKQLFGESEGKDGKGLFTASVDFSTDLHSLGQFIQDGSRNLFETVLSLETAAADLKIPFDEKDGDGLNFLSGMNLHDVNVKAMLGTLVAHNDGGVPNLLIRIPELNAFHIGYLLYFFEKACAVSGYLLGVNPFDQPGVEAYKKNMFALLGKSGFETLRSELEKRIL